MSHQYSRVIFDSSVEVVEDNLSMYYGGVIWHWLSVTCQLGRTGGMPTGNETKLRIP